MKKMLELEIVWKEKKKYTIFAMERVLLMDIIILHVFSKEVVVFSLKIGTHSVIFCSFHMSHFSKSEEKVKMRKGHKSHSYNSQIYDLIRLLTADDTVRVSTFQYVLVFRSKTTIFIDKTCSSYLRKQKRIFFSRSRKANAAIKLIITLVMYTLLHIFSQTIVVSDKKFEF